MRRIIVTGAAGQDGFFLTRDLLAEGSEVHAIVRSVGQRNSLVSDLGKADRLHIHVIDLAEPEPVEELLRSIRPDELYNLAGRSSVGGSFRDPAGSWQINAALVEKLLEWVRLHSPETRFYQASSTEMYGGCPEPIDESTPLRPNSPYAAAKAAAHVFCQGHRASFGLRVACGILSNHESSRRSPEFLIGKVLDYVCRLNRGENLPPLRVGNLKIERDWGYAPEFVRGIISILRQVDVRSQRFDSEPDIAERYRDYLLATGHSLAVWQLIDAAVSLVGRNLTWTLEGDSPERWKGFWSDSGDVAVEVSPELLRPTDQPAVRANAAAARRDLGWHPQNDLRGFFRAMIEQPAAEWSWGRVDFAPL